MYDPTPSNLVGVRFDVMAAAVYLINAYRSVGIPAVVTSGRRSVAHNISVGGAVQSRHLNGTAIDVGFLGGSQAEQQLWLQAGGELWQMMGGRWGGTFVVPDPLHFDAG